MAWVSEDYSDFKEKFDENGNLVGIELPLRVEERIYWKMKDERLRDDIRITLSEMCDRKRAMEITDQEIDDILDCYYENWNGDIAYNVMLTNAIKDVLEGE